jgi:hypothetical protein
MAISLKYICVYIYICIYIYPGDDLLKVEMFNGSTLFVKELCMNIDCVKWFNVCDVEMC